MSNVDKMIAQFLDMDIIGTDDKVVFTDEAKQLIYEISDKLIDSPIILNNKERMEEYGKGMSAEVVYLDMMHKMINAPTNLCMKMCARMLIPVIAMKLKERDV